MPDWDTAGLAMEPILSINGVLLADDENAPCLQAGDESSPRVVSAEADSFPAQHPGTVRPMPRAGRPGWDGRCVLLDGTLLRGVSNIIEMRLRMESLF